MSSVTLSVGLDYHEDQVQVCVLDADGRVLLNRPCRNDWTALAAAVDRPGVRVRAALEACCGAADLAEELAEKAGWSVSLAHPGFVARMKQNPDKTDFSDARLLADLLRVGYLPKVWLAPEEVRELRRLVRFRQQLVNERRNVKLRLRGLMRDCRVKAPAGLRPWTVNWLAWLASGEQFSSESRWILARHLERLKDLVRQVREAEERLRQAAEGDAVIVRLQAFRGIGLVTAVTLRAEIGRFDRFRSGKQLARFVGLSPRNASSGQRQADAGLIKAGNPQLRATIIEAAHRLVIFREPRWSELARQLLARGKPRSVVIAAVANRWVRWLYHQMQPQSLTA